MSQKAIEFSLLTNKQPWN